jgi:MFS family permease
MMIGAVGWGTISDLLGRALPFNSTLFLTAVFGIGASFAPSFPVLCVWMFFLGSAVGYVAHTGTGSYLEFALTYSGSMPTDGTLFLENLPHSKQYLLTLLSVFFSLGAVLSSVVSLIFLPGASCREFEGCDIEGKANDGWRKVLLVLGIFVSPTLFQLSSSCADGRTCFVPSLDGVSSGCTSHLGTSSRMAARKRLLSCCGRLQSSTITLSTFSTLMSNWTMANRSTFSRRR